MGGDCKLSLFLTKEPKIAGYLYFIVKKPTAIV